MSHVFISYVREDTAIVDRIAAELRSRRLEVWLDREMLRPGERWKDAIRSAISQGAYFLACFSTSYTSKDASYMNEELTLAIEELRLKANARRWFIPLLLSECEVPARSIGAGETLLDFQWIDLYSDFNQGMIRLAGELNSKEVAHLKSLIEEYGDKYIGTIFNPASSTAEKDKAFDRHLRLVEKLKALYGIWYDPHRILRNHPPR
jgi:hypothetical protein